MKEGINFATRPGILSRAPTLLGRSAFIGLVLISLIHVGTVWRSREAIEEVRREVESVQDELSELREALEASRTVLSSPSSSRVIDRLMLVDRAGLTRALEPTRVLLALAEALPDRARIEVLRLDAESAPVQLHLEVVSDDPRAVLELTSTLSSSDAIGSADLLEETPLDTGGLVYRIDARLDSRVTR